ncbi:hypothetical protein BGZ51_006190 [Haplosporangium sp. Z 767]|nr:hypothetical protein BGZ51_006190 [Haplosporangium sp. Z 767]KAF9180670.1 hypothetical protein BGZ50_006058 [Haplosporangium sp. Z 11]
MQAFSSTHQVREAFLRAGPGRELGSAVRKQPTLLHPSNPPQNRTSPRSSSSSSLDSTALGVAATEPDSTSSSVTDTSDTTSSASASATVTTSVSTSTPLAFKYKEITLLDTDFRERFIKGGGNGGQKINKTNSNVELKHYETGIVVQCQATRSLPQNRKLARRILIERLDEYYNGEMSKRGQKAEKIRERKKRMARKSAKKYHGAGTVGAEDDNDDDDNDDEDNDDSEGKADNGSGDQQGQDTKTGQNAIPENTIQLTTLEEVLAGDNKKPSRRKAARK